ncbi:hypothetical protein FPOAC1_005354 [Fusarium poae]|uniref:hypothetical protein n=1 Tax=Fusarium poae TaxID=36050 RepID=UPI001CEBF1EF|nr:hypothetical protein FPOAC1_005354 [Fusarium poae]KAG8672093.1 hypothetical protein FPOAC1_005354 [Fusarium poae]
MQTFAVFLPTFTHWINNDLVADQEKFVAACHAMYPRDSSGYRSVEVCFDTPERPGYVKVNCLSREPLNLLDELRAKGGDNGLKREEVKVEANSGQTGN